MSFLEGYQTTPSFQTLHSNATFQKLDDDAIKKRMEREAPKVQAYLKLNNFVLESHANKLYSKEMIGPITELLDWNPELYTVWNYRRDLFQHLGLLSHEIISKELTFVLLKLKQHPKSYWIWNHRIWCLQNDPQPNWVMELGLIQKFFEADSRNYHAWQYRRVIVKLMKGDDWTEWKFTREMINKDISNYSAWHNRSNLVQRLFKDIPVASHDDDNDPYLKCFIENNKYDFILKEWDLLKTAIYTDAEDSSVWFYIKWLLDDYFLNDIKNNPLLLSLLTKIYDEIEELNELEMDDNGVENKWCENTKLHIIDQFIKHGLKSPHMELRSKTLETLRKLDPMRANRYH